MSNANGDFPSETPLVVIHGYDEGGTCAFCRKEKEGVYCTFDGGRFDGFLCRNDFWKFLRLDSPTQAESHAGRNHATPLFDGKPAEAGV